MTVVDASHEDARAPTFGTSARRSLAARVAALLDARTSRRGFLARVAVVGSALTVSPVGFLLRPGTAYAAVCGTDSTCASGYTVFCCTINNGVNRCPPAAWWAAVEVGQLGLLLRKRPLLHRLPQLLLVRLRHG